MKDYSQSGEQKIILQYFGDFRGTCMEIGANDGLTLSNTRALIVDKEWDSILVEPAETAFRKLVGNNIQTFSMEGKLEDVKHVRGTWMRRDGSERFVWCVQAAITTQDGLLDFYSSGTHLKKGDTDLLSTTRPEELARWKRSGEVFTKTMVRGITFNTLLKETGLTRADFISIDCEGVDLDVLRQIDLTALGTRMVCVEVNRNDQRPFDEYCAKHGMRLLHRNYENAIYVR